MSTRAILTLTLSACCVAGAWGVYVQDQHLTDLRAERARLADGAQAGSNGDLSSATGLGQPEGSASATPVEATSPAELLRLRNQISQLTGRKRELAPALAENERLKAQLAARGTNAAAGNAALPPGYIRKSQAQWMGLSSPENTLQTFLWALRNQDLTNLMLTLDPESQNELIREIRASPEKFFKEASSLPGMRILSQQSLPDGSIEADMEIIPGAHDQKIHFRLIDGQWKLGLD